jgi:hypothetical protein
LAWNAVSFNRDLTLSVEAIRAREGQMIDERSRGRNVLSLPELRNMVLAAESGAMVLPAMPGFYQQPKTIEDLAAFIAGKILSGLGFDQQLFPPWQG